MRIIAGTKRGMKLLPPKDDTTRPIIDRIKESIFSVLYKYNLIEGRRIADLFCGTGSFGLEALSRGAAGAVFVEQNSKVVDILKKNLEKAGFVDASKVIRANAFKIGAPVGFEEKKYSLVFIDPPYALSRETSVNSQLGKLLGSLGGQLMPDGLVIVRTEKKVSLLDKYGQLEIIDRRTWSGMAVTFLRVENNDE